MLESFSNCFIFSLLCILLSSCQSLPKNVQRPVSYFNPHTEKTRLASALTPFLKAHPGESAFYPIASGQDALVARIASIEAADKTIDLQYYIWNNDLTGRFLLYEVLKAADRGVRVRILLDDLNEGKYQEFLNVLDSHPNIEIRLANPFANRGARVFDLFRFGDINRRMHNKVFIVDNQTAIIGGRNIGDEYFAASEDMNFGDLDLWTFGPVVPELSKAFDRSEEHTSELQSH